MISASCQLLLYATTSHTPAVCHHMFPEVFQVDMRKSLTNAYVLLELQREAIWAFNAPACISIIGDLVPATLKTWDRLEIGNPIPN